MNLICNFAQKILSGTNQFAVFVKRQFVISKIVKYYLQCRHVEYLSLYFPTLFISGLHIFKHCEL